MSNSGVLADRDERLRQNEDRYLSGAQSPRLFVSSAEWADMNRWVLYRSTFVRWDSARASSIASACNPNSWPTVLRRAPSGEHRSSQMAQSLFSSRWSEIRSTGKFSLTRVPLRYRRVRTPGGRHRPQHQSVGSRLGAGRIRAPSQGKSLARPPGAPPPRPCPVPITGTLWMRAHGNATQADCHGMERRSQEVRLLAKVNAHCHRLVWASFGRSRRSPRRRSTPKEQPG